MCFVVEEFLLEIEVEVNDLQTHSPNIASAFGDYTMGRWYCQVCDLGDKTKTVFDFLCKGICNLE